ncbi:hypothetical protein TWF730_005120 [Orbilia blumenaviensis]|uniref:Tyrosinase C-terminal domain-containing protein n=1 Tax=Orbilia blumenaviensis TaxID=1796055 RepID=A0AAV9VHC6_9PEZI
MWQVLNPTQWTTPQVTLFGTRTNPAGTTENSATGLSPFYRYPNTMWTSNTARDTKRFYYTYPETNGLSADQLRTRIQQLYGGTAPQNQVRGAATKRSYTGGSLATDGKYHEWAANVRLNKYEAGGTYLIHMFIGAPTKGVEWTSDPNFVGSYYLLTKNGTCHGCSENSLVTGSVPLTHTLIKCIKTNKLRDLSPDAVVKYLKTNLNWRVQLVCPTTDLTDKGPLLIGNQSGSNNNYLDPKDIKSLKISVTAATVTLPSSSGQDAPITKWTTYYDITDKKPGGLCYGDQS